MSETKKIQNSKTASNRKPNGQWESKTGKESLPNLSQVLKVSNKLVISSEDREVIDDVVRNYNSQPSKWYRYGRDLLSSAGFPQNWNTAFGKEFDDHMDKEATSDAQLSAIIAFYRENGTDLRIRFLLRSTAAMSTHSFLRRRIGA